MVGDTPIVLSGPTPLLYSLGEIPLANSGRGSRFRSRVDRIDSKHPGEVGSMSLQPEPAGPVPDETARVARAAFPKGSVYM
jgi:hypothetical protein